MMGASFDDTVFDFDLNFLNQPTTSNTEQETQARLDKLRRSIIYLKKKIVFSDAAVSRYKTARHYARVLENNQLYTNEGCKQHLIEIRSFIDKVAKLETENRQLEDRVKEKTKEIGDLQNKYEALEKAGNQIQLLLKEKSKVPDPPKPNVDKEKKRDSCKSCTKNQIKYDLLDKEIETLRKDNGKLSRLERENEKLLKENARIPSLAQEILQLRKEVSDVATPDSINDGAKKATAKIQILQKEVDDLLKENSKIAKLEKEIELLRVENAKAKNFEKEIAILHRQTAKIPGLRLENEVLRKECTKIPKLEKEVSVLSVKNAKLTNMERLHKTLCDELVKIPNKGQELENLLTRFNLVFPVYIPIHTEGTSLMQDNDIGGAEDTVVPLSPVPNNAVNQSPIVKTTPEPCHFNGDVINEVDNADTGRRSSLNNSNTEIPAESLIQIEDLVVTSTVPVIVYNENQGIHRNKHTTDSRQTQTVPIVSNSKSVPIIHSDDDTSTKSEVKERILSAKVPTIVYNENNICNDKNVIKSQEHHVQKVTAVDQTPIANKSKDNIATTKSKAQLKESVKIAAIPTIVYNQNVDSNCNKRAIKAQGHHSQKAIYATKKSFCPAVSKHRSKQIAREKESLELNNSKVRESRTELELEKIFNNMKMTFEAVTPIPKTPTKITEENSISDPSEKLLKCMMLSDKSDQLLIKLKEYMHCLTKDLICQSNPRLSIQSHTFGSKSMSGKYNIDKLIKCFETILGSEQILSEDSINVPQNIQISEKPLANEENNLVSIIFEQETDKYNLPEVTDSMHADTDIIQEDTHILQNHQEDFSNLSSENIQSPDISIPEKDIIILLNFQDEKRLSPQNSQPLEPKTPLAPSERPGRAIKRPGRTKIHKEAKKALCSDISLPEKDIIILQNFQDEKQLSPQNSQPQEPKAPLSPSNKRPGRAEIHKEANKVLCSPPKLPITPLSPRLRSFTQNEQNNSSNSPPKQIKALLSPRSKNAMQDEIDQLPQKILITPRTKRKISELFDNCAVVITKDETILDTVANKSVVHEKAQEENESPNVTTARRKRRQSSDEPVVQPKRILRSSNQKGENIKKSVENTNAEESTSKPIQSPKPALDGKLVQYDDLDMWSDDDHQELVHHRESVTAKEVNTEICHPKESILCCMVEKYGVVSVKPFAKKVPDNAIKQICEKIEKEITAISELPMNETKAAMNKFVADLRKLNYKHFISGMMKYLTKPERKQELFGKISLTSAPAMTKAEQILLYVVAQLKTHWPLDIVDAILSNIEYTLFRLNRTPEFDVIESMSHFYALLCRYIGAKSRLRLFILDAMYCIQYKSVPLIKQCIEIWMHIIPLAHMGIAKNPLVTCLVYLLHFYKCDDKSNRVQEIRNILSRKYFYQITDWNETKILEMFKNCIKDLKDISIERKTLRLALIILAKRHGPRWCQNNIIKNLLQPMIENEGVSDNVKEFCVSMIGPLMKPYPVDMKIYCEIAMNQLTDILNNNPSPKMEEAAITSMLFINRHNQDSVNKILLSRKMKPLSPDLEKTLSDYVKTKPLNMWKKHLSIIARAT